MWSSSCIKHGRLHGECPCSRVAFVCAARQQPKQRGDVESVDFADSPTPDTFTGALGRIPEPDERLAIRLVGHPFTYVVRVATAKGRDPRLAELTMLADNPRDDGGDVDYSAVRSVPVRRLAYTAAQWIVRWGGQVSTLADTSEVWTQPENNDPRVYKAAQIAEQALSLGQPVRPTVAAQMNVSPRTVDRLLKRARDEGWFDGQPLPKRPQPQQRDTKTSQETDR
jgi:hypothetical protein